MPILTSVMRTNLKALSPLLKRGTLESARALQAKTGELMRLMNIFESDISGPVAIGGCEAVWAVPDHVAGRGAVLYLHGGGYCTGNLEYASGFGSTLASGTGRRVLCAAYRLAPENPFPAALEDAVSAYEYLLEQGYEAREITLCGESAGGGLILCLCLKLRELELPLPSALVCISPWTDLAMTGGSIDTNRRLSPTLSPEILEFYAESYAGSDRENPLVSPLYGELGGFPPVLIFAGGEELILSDSLMLHDRLLKQGVDSRLHIEEKLWHDYVLYNIREAIEAVSMISEFLEEMMG